MLLVKANNQTLLDSRRPLWGRSTDKFLLYFLSTVSPGRGKWQLHIRRNFCDRDGEDKQMAQEYLNRKERQGKGEIQ